MEFSERLTLIKNTLKQHNMTYEDLSKSSNIPISTIMKVLSGHTKSPRIDTIIAIEKALGLDQRADIYSIPGVLPIATKKVPLIGTIACGSPILAVENIEDYIDMDETVHANFCLRCKGDSMINARIMDGDIVYIRQQETVENGQIAAVLVDGEATLKRLFFYGDKIELRAENPTFASIYIDNTHDIRIIGLAIAFLSSVR